MTRAGIAVRLRGIDKRFGAVQANRGVDLTVAAGSVHAIVGENGAGKSTLMAILYGLHAADAGSIEIDGAPVRIRDTRDAIAYGIGMVHQHFMLVDTLSAIDNVLLGAEPHWSLQRARVQARQRLRELMAETGLQVRLDLEVERLPVGERQRLEILKALFRGARILILDEPTAVLTPQEIEALFATLRALRERGTTILLITHKLKEVMALADAVTVMRQGGVALATATEDTSVDALAQAMVGRSVHLGREGPSSTAGGSGAVLLRAECLCWRDPDGVARLDGLSLQLRAGEIVGVAGVSGNGQSELLEVLSGMLQADGGSLEIDGQRFGARRRLTPASARDLGIAHVPEDRQRRGLVMSFPAWESALLGYHRRRRYGRAGFLRRAVARADTRAMMERYDVRPRDPDLCTAGFSGGNQQKLVLAREAMNQPKVLLVGQPTRGVDVGAVEFIHARLRAMRDAGSAVLVVSSDLDEILALADRVLVMQGGRLAGELPVSRCDERTLGRLMGAAGSATR